MGMQNPNVETFEPTDKLADVYAEGTPFFLEGIRVVKAKTADFGDGEMVLLKVRGHERELGVWGAYLTVQAKSVSPGDLGRWYVLNRRLIDGFGKNRPSKVLDPAEGPTEMGAAAKMTGA